MWTILAILAVVPQSQPAPKVKVEPVAIQVVRGLGQDAEELMGFMREEGTKISLRVVSEEAGILSVDSQKSKVTKMADDKGTDLLAVKPKKEKFGGSSPIGSFPKFSKDGKSCVLDLEAAGLPAKGSKSVLIEGSLSLTLAQGQDTSKQAAVKLEKGTKFKAGDLEFEVQKTEKDGFDEQRPHVVTLGAGKGGQRLAKLRFLDAAGKEIESQSGGTMRMSGFGGDSWSWDYRLKAELKACTIEVTLWKTVTQAEVPLKLEVSLGL